MGMLGSIQKLFLLSYGQKVDIIRCTNGLCVADTVHWVFGNEVVLSGAFEERTHCHIGLPDG